MTGTFPEDHAAPVPPPTDAGVPLASQPQTVPDDDLELLATYPDLADLPVRLLSTWGCYDSDCAGGCG